MKKKMLMLFLVINLLFLFGVGSVMGATFPPDFGIWQPFEPKEFPDYNLELHFAVGHKFASYMEAGIPFFCSPKNIFLINFAKRYGIDIPVSNEKGSIDIKNLKKRLKNINYKDMERKIAIVRKEYLMEKEFPRLEKFVKEVVRKKLNKKEQI